MSILDALIWGLASDRENLPQRIKDLGYYTLFLPSQWYTTLSVEVSDSMIACDSVSFLQKVAYRTSTPAGIADSSYIIVAAGLGWLGHWNPFFRSTLYDVFEPLLLSFYFFGDDTKALTCMEVGFILGQIPKAVLNVDSPREVFYRNVNSYEFRDQAFVCLNDPLLNNYGDDVYQCGQDYTNVDVTVVS